jgi:hypothetical protein
MARTKAVEKQGEALAYLRTSSAQNIGGDSDQRQRAAIARFAKAHGHELVGEFYDAAVSGADPIETRPGFTAMLERIEGNGVRVVLVEDASRFARSVIAQELGVLAMQARGVRVLTASGEDLTSTDDPAKIMMRQIAGAFAQYEKARLVAKLRGARDQRGVAQSTDADHKVIALLDHVDEAVGQGKLDLDTRIARHEVDDRRRQVQLPERHRAVDPEQPRGLELMLRQLGRGDLVFGEDPPTALEERGAGAGDREPPGGAVHQLRAEIPLQGRHPFADQRTRKAQLLGGVVEAAHLDQGDERLHPRNPVHARSDWQRSGAELALRW